MLLVLILVLWPPIYLIRRCLKTRIGIEIRRHLWIWGIVTKEHLVTWMGNGRQFLWSWSTTTTIGETLHRWAYKLKSFKAHHGRVIAMMMASCYKRLVVECLDRWREKAVEYIKIRYRSSQPPPLPPAVPVAPLPMDRQQQHQMLAAALTERRVIPQDVDDSPQGPSNQGQMSAPGHPQGTFVEPVRATSRPATTINHTNQDGRQRASLDMRDGGGSNVTRRQPEVTKHRQKKGKKGRQTPPPTGPRSTQLSPNTAPGFVTPGKGM